jgi:hypothetical protein
MSNSIQSINNTGADTMNDDADNIFAPLSLNGLTTSTIASSAVLVKVSISKWGAKKKDREATRKINSDNGVKNNAGEATKVLMKDNPKMRIINAVDTRIRNMTNDMSNPWDDDGQRVLPISRFPEHKTATDTLVQEFNSAVEDFITDYENAIAADAFALQGMFNRADYPTSDQIRSKFGVSITYSPIPESGHFALAAESRLVNEITEQFSSSSHRALVNGINSLWMRMYQGLRYMIEEKLTPEFNADGKEKGKRFHGAFMRDLENLVSLLKTCNLTNDPKIAEAARDLERLVLGIDVNDLKKHKDARDDLREKAQAVLDKFSLNSLAATADSLSDDGDDWN